MPSLTELLAETEALVTEHETTVRTVKEKIAELRKNKDLFELWSANRVKRMETIKGIKNPYESLSVGEDLSAETLAGLTESGLLSYEMADQIKKMDELIARLGSVQFPTDEIRKKKETLINTRAKLCANLNTELYLRRNEFEERRKRIREKTLNVYNKRTGRFGQTIHTLENDETVKEALQKEALKREILAHLQSVESRLKTAMDNLARALQVESVDKGLTKTMELKGKDRGIHVYNLRADLVPLVRSGAIGSASDVAPWKTKSGNKYLSSLRFLNNPATARKIKELGDEELTSRVQKARDLHEALSLILGREQEITLKDAKGAEIKKEKSSFWRAMDEKK